MESKVILGYKIRHSKTRKFLSSVSNKKWTSVGKTWPRRGDAVRAINAGLQSFKRYNKYKQSELEDIIDDLVHWEVVELAEISSFPVLFFVDKIRSGE